MRPLVQYEPYNCITELVFDGKMRVASLATQQQKLSQAYQQTFFLLHDCLRLDAMVSWTLRESPFNLPNRKLIRFMKRPRVEARGFRLYKIVHQESECIVRVVSGSCARSFCRVLFLGRKKLQNLWTHLHRLVLYTKQKNNVDKKWSMANIDFIAIRNALITLYEFITLFL